MLDGPVCMATFCKHFGVCLTIPQCQSDTFCTDIFYAATDYHLCTYARFGMFFIRVKQYDVATAEVGCVGRLLLGEACHESCHPIIILLEIIQDESFVDVSCSPFLLQ